MLTSNQVRGPSTTKVLHHVKKSAAYGDSRPLKFAPALLLLCTDILYGARGRMRGQLLKEQTSTGPRRFGPSIHEWSCSWILFLDPTAWSSRHRQQPKAKSKRPPWARLRLARVKCVMWTRGRQLISHRTAEATQPHQKSQLYSVTEYYKYDALRAAGLAPAKGARAPAEVQLRLPGRSL